jgi:hypothetical protein
MQKGEKKGRRIFSFVALAGACIVVGVYLIIPIMICLHITDTILAILIAALILTVMEGIVGIILVRIGTSRELKKSRLGKKASASVQQSATPALLPMPRLSPAKSPALLPMPRLAPAKSPAQPAFLPAVPAVGVPEQMRVGNAGRPAMPVTDPLRLADVAQVETIRINGSPITIVPPLLKLPASS